jgi:putative copper export protein
MAPLKTLHWSLIVETACGVGVLALVAVLGTLPPPTV